VLRFTTYHHPVPLSRNLGTLTSWNPLGHSGPVMGLLYLIWDKKELHEEWKESIIVPVHKKGDRIDCSK